MSDWTRAGIVLAVFGAVVLGIAFLLVLWYGLNVAWDRAHPDD